MPSYTPAEIPIITPSEDPSEVLSSTFSSLTAEPTNEPTNEPTLLALSVPSSYPSVSPNMETIAPSVFTSMPTAVPTTTQSSNPIINISPTPTIISVPSASPSIFPSVTPTINPSTVPTTMPSVTSSRPSSVSPSFIPTTAPIIQGIYEFTGPELFDGVNTKIVAGSLAQRLSKQFSISMFITCPVHATDIFLMTLGRSDSKPLSNSFVFLIESNGKLSYFDNKTKKKYGFAPGTGFSAVPVNTNQRTHVGFVKKGFSGVFYINGVRSGEFSAEDKTLIRYRNHLVLGYNVKGNKKHFEGEMDDVSLFNVALTDEDMLNLYTGTRPTFSYKMN
eukprot:CAMPEP_0182423536 /NCGR_PEP_ID=MMETSP1167-20130531/9582_1 /TAXON_ID=2988 /ORGANISM="Mallomonas Sp, Strain CCMP3275" /LENGTH=332 /DNA_ID=CAMNT_0024602621 /DNA_START=117 /DNA_END=1115 /DNA_ORIENTATION=-